MNEKTIILSESEKYVSNAAGKWRYYNTEFGLNEAVFESDVINKLKNLGKKNKKFLEVLKQNFPMHNFHF